MIKIFVQPNKPILRLFLTNYKNFESLRINESFDLYSIPSKSQSFLTINLTYLFTSKKQNQSFKISTKKQTINKKVLTKIRPSEKQLRKEQKENKKFYNLSITDPQLFVEYINSKANIRDAVKLMNRILNTKNFSKEEFEKNVWKKYSYYVYLVAEKQLQAIVKLNFDQISLQKSDNSYNQVVNQNQTIGAEQANTQNNLEIHTNSFLDNHEIARQKKQKFLRLQFLDQITQIHKIFGGSLQSQNVTKAMNKFADFYLQKQEWSKLFFSQKVSILQSLSRYNIKKTKTILLKNRSNLFLQPKIQSSQRSQSEQIQYPSEFVIRILSLVSELEINDTPMFQKCIELLYGQIDSMNLVKLEQITFLLGKSHKFINKDFLLKLRNRFNNLINQFDDQKTIRALHIVSSFSMIEKNMQLASTYFEPLDSIYQRILPVFDSALLRRLKSKFISTIASALRRSQYYDEAVLRSIAQQCMRREVIQFSKQPKWEMGTSENDRKSSSLSQITISHLNQVFFAFASFNYRNPEFMSYFINLLKIVQSSRNSQQYISFQLFNKLLWSICVVCNEKEIQQLLPLMEHFYNKARKVQPHEATNFYYCYLLLKRKYLLSDIRFENDKIQQYLSGPQHQVRASQIQHQIHKHLLKIGIPSLVQYNLNNIICDIYIPKLHSLQHVIIEVHGFHHFCRNVKRLNGSTVLKQKIIENEGYICFYLSLDEWLIADDKEDFLKKFFEFILSKKHRQKEKRKSLENSLKTRDKVEKRGRRVLEFKKTNHEQNRLQISTKSKDHQNSDQRKPENQKLQEIDEL